MAGWLGKWKGRIVWVLVYSALVYTVRRVYCVPRGPQRPSTYPACTEYLPT